MAVTFWIDLANVDGSPLEGASADVAGTAVALAGLAVGAAGVLAFRRAGTTVDPHHIENASALVTGGIYRLTRNPMYLGLVLISMGWGIRLGSAIGTIVGPALIFAALTRFQIMPEERMMSERFGDEYRAFQGRVRRWI